MSLKAHWILRTFKLTRYVLFVPFCGYSFLCHFVAKSTSNWISGAFWFIFRTFI